MPGARLGLLMLVFELLLLDGSLAGLLLADVAYTPNPKPC